MMTDGEYGRCVKTRWARACDGRSVIRQWHGPANEPAKRRLTAFPYYHGMLLEPVDYVVLLIGTAAITGWGFVLLGLS